MTAPAGAVLEVRGACRRYGERIALDAVSLAIEPGEVYVLIGHNGAGKSSLAKAAIGALALDAGDVRVMGADPARDARARRAIGVAPQEIALFPRLTIAENLRAFATLSGVTVGLDEAVRAAMRDTACEARAGERLDQLSGGWRRRANLAAAIVHRPRLLVLDEPTEGLDPDTRGVLDALVLELKARGAAILLISHATREAAVLADRVGILDQGRLMDEGRPADLMARAFGARQEILVRLLAPCPQAAALLGARGLTALDHGLTFRGLAQDAPALALELDRVLEAAGGAIGELVVRPPSLETLITWAQAASRA